MCDTGNVFNNTTLSIISIWFPFHPPPLLLDVRPFVSLSLSSCKIDTCTHCLIMFSFISKMSTLADDKPTICRRSQIYGGRCYSYHTKASLSSQEILKSCLLFQSFSRDKGRGKKILNVDANIFVGYNQM